MYRSEFFEDYFDHRLAEFPPRMVFWLDGYDCPTSPCEVAREVDLRLRVLFRFHYAMVVYVAVMDWTVTPVAIDLMLRGDHCRDLAGSYRGVFKVGC